MKTAAAIILLIAIIGMFPKHKKKHPEPARGAPPIVQNRSCSPEDPMYTDETLVGRIVKHARAIRPRSGQSEEELTFIAQNIVKYSANYCIEPELAAALIARESGYYPRAVSRSGACGLGQMIPSTARNMGISDCFDVDQNVNGTLRYFRGLLDRWSGYDDQTDCALASYLSGPGNVSCGKGAQWQNGSTSRYLQDIYSYRNKMKSY